MKKKYDIDRIVAFLKGELKGQDKAQFIGKMAADADLAEMKAVVEQLLEAGELNRSDDAAGGRQLAMSIYRDYIRKLKQPKTSHGVVIFDSWNLPLPEGVREAEVDSRWRSYRFEKFELDISTHPITPDSLQVTGRVNGLDPGTAIMISMKSGKRRYQSEGDPNNIFYFSRLPSGSYILTISGPDGISGVITLDL